MVFMATKMENQYLSLLKAYKFQILLKPALNSFFTSFLKKMQNMNNFAFLHFSNLILNFSSIWNFYIPFVSKYCVIKMHFLDIEIMIR